MKKISLYLGGARSGKSRRALDISETSHASGCFIATAEVTDGEFAERIAQHQAERDDRWQTVEAPVDLTNAIASADQMDGLIVVDCLTVWLGNLMHYERNLDDAVAELLELLPRVQADVRLVSNEVGLGVVPETPLGRQFRDYQGRLNQQVAALADHVELMVAGIPMVVKSERLK